MLIGALDVSLLVNLLTDEEYLELEKVKAF